MGIKRFFYFFLLISAAMTIFWFCKADDGEGSGYCYNCITTEPDTAEMIIRVTLNKDNLQVPVAIYENEYQPENPGTPIWSDTINGTSTFKKYFHTNKTYSVVATYKSGNRKIKAADGGVFNRQEQSGCETTCWQLIGGDYDVRLKNY